MKDNFRKKLIEIFRGGSILNTDSILARLEIDPTDDKKVQVIIKELKDMGTEGLIESALRGWKWRGWTVMDDGHLLPHR
jgi:hypothetical protein